MAIEHFGPKCNLLANLRPPLAAPKNKQSMLRFRYDFSTLSLSLSLPLTIDLLFIWVYGHWAIYGYMAIRIYGYMSSIWRGWQLKIICAMASHIKYSDKSNPELTTHMNMYLYLYMYMCVCDNECVCVCVWLGVCLLTICGVIWKLLLLGEGRTANVESVWEEIKLSRANESDKEGVRERGI